LIACSRALGLDPLRRPVVPLAAAEHGENIFCGWERVCYIQGMSSSSPKRSRGHALKVRLGDRFEARATGWGVAAVPLVVLLLVAAALMRHWLGA
jgi:hypothetical protein